MPIIPEHYSYDVAVNPEQGPGEITVLFAGEGRPVELHNTGPGVHDYFLMHTVLSGHGSFSLNGNRYICGEGDTFLIFPGALFQYIAAEREPWHYAWAAFYGHRCEPLLQRLGLTPERPVARGADPRKSLTMYRRLRRALRAEDPVLADLESEGLLRLLLHELALADRPHRPQTPPALSNAKRIVAQAMRWLELQYDRPISIEQLSSSLGYHRTHLSKMFKETVGLSPMQYLMQLRLERGKSLLASSLTVEQIASSVGFSDPLHFSKQFRKKYGLSPVKLRHRMNVQFPI